MVTPSHVLAVEDLTVVVRGRRILSDLTLSCADGVTAILGVNGSGKSTLMRAVMGLVPVTSGEVRVVGYEVPRQLRSARRHAGYLPQHSFFPGRFSVLDALDYAAWLQRMSPGRSRERIEELLEALNLRKVRHQGVGSLSGGTLQRLLLAQAIIHAPPLVLLDEPTVGLDMTQQAAFRSVIADLARDSCVVLSTHQGEDVERLADYVAVISRGRAVWSGTMAEFEALPSGSRDAVDRGSRIEASISALIQSDTESDPIHPDVAHGIDHGAGRGGRRREVP